LLEGLPGIVEENDLEAGVMVLLIFPVHFSLHIST
jgi:hypothetical protein